MKVTPEIITSLKPNEVFVFGSNLAGRHGAGAALMARQRFGARNGIGVGLCGQSYAIPTKGYAMDVLPIGTIHKHVLRFICCVMTRTDEEYLVTAVGCGLAGYRPADIAPLFFACGPIPVNVSLPKSFWEFAPAK